MDPGISRELHNVLNFQDSHPTQKIISDVEGELFRYEGCYLAKAMRTTSLRIQIVSGMVITISVLFSAPAESQPVRGSFIYTLSSFTGPIPYNHSRVTADKGRNEIYVLYQNALRVFNESGMEIYYFGEDLDLGHIVDVAVNREGDVLLLAYKDSRSEIVRLNYRGEPKGRTALRNLPGDFSNFSPNRMVYQDEKFYLASLGEMRIVIADQEGSFRRGYDLFRMLELEEKERGNTEIGGFGVDREGNILMTIPVLFSAYVLSPDGKISSFGRPGSAPGRFNIVGGIARDSRGNYLVVDKLKSAVMVFDKSFKFLTQFGTRGYKPGNLIFPDEIAVDSGDRIYVTQMGKRGVNVYKLTYN